MTNEFELRDTARELKAHYLQLHALKHTTPNPPEVKTRNVVKGLGPKSPGNWLWVNRYVEMEQNLRELALNAFGIDGINIRLHDGDLAAPRLCHLIAYHAQPLTELPWAADLMQELEDQARTINRWVNPPEVQALANQPEPRHGAEHIAKQLRARGIPTTADTIRGWARRGHITRTTMPNRRAGYLLTEALNHAKKETK
ncbi:hypothetical protein [Corynebacterium sp. MSK158]|uniref:hypothetical protein n=1 Tax=Corynebacterium sp. MSK158 TaxID=3050212 RepID=UPI00254FDC13|nr:hypothetical protein [Corynebacterium sp. MSK158]MDK8693592.1 hypothetical protein [Corynebacterium sp. MSK158]